MSLSQETIDQLLSGYMDDALTAEECEQLETLLQSDAEVNRQWEELRQQRETLRSLARADRGLRLDAGFADRVLDAAIDQARAQGLGDEHPLVRLAEQPSGTAQVARWKPRTWQQVVGICAALAASVTLAVVLWNPPQHGDTPHSLADADILKNQASELKNQTSETSRLAVDQTNIDPTPNDPTPSDPTSNDPAPNGRLATSEDPILDRPASDDPSPSALASSSEGPADRMDKVAENRALNSNSTRTPASKTSDFAAASSPQRQVGAVMVLDVTMTQAGRDSRAVRRALRDAAINMHNEKLMSEDIVGVMNESQLNQDDSLHGVSVMYLEGSAKELDRFILSLCGDSQGIEAVRFGLASELPILNLLEKLQRPVDPRTVQHSTGWIVEGKSPAVSRSLTHALADRTMVSLSDNASEVGMITGAAMDGPDVMSQLFVIVR